MLALLAILPKEKFGIPIPRNTHEALLFDKQNGNTKWADAIAKEMTGLDHLKAFIYHPPTKVFPKSAGWKFAPIHMIFTVKQEDGRYKARLVAGGHVVDSSITPHIRLLSKVGLFDFFDSLHCNKDSP